VAANGNRIPFKSSGGLALALLALAALPGRKRFSRMLVLVVLCAGLSVAVGCGGSSNQTHKTQSTTTPAPPGTYTVTVTGVSSGITHSATLYVQVQ
jgi:hypothetical protein